MRIKSWRPNDKHDLLLQRKKKELDKMKDIGKKLQALLTDELCDEVCEKTWYKQKLYAKLSENMELHNKTCCEFYEQLRITLEEKTK